MSYHPNYEPPSEEVIEELELENEDLEILEWLSWQSFGKNGEKSCIDEEGKADEGKMDRVQREIDEHGRGLRNTSPLEKTAEISKRRKKKRQEEEEGEDGEGDGKKNGKKGKSTGAGDAGGEMDSLLDKAMSVQKKALGQYQAGKRGKWFKDLPKQVLHEHLGSAKMIEEILQKIKSSTNTIKLGSDEDLIEDSQGDITIRRPMESLDELQYVSPFDFAHPLFFLRLISDELDIDVKYSTVKTVRKILLLFDESGSMATKYKQSCIRAIFLYLAEGVLRGEMILYVSFYEWNVYGFTEIKTEQDILDFLYNWKMPQGGGTNIANVLQQCAGFIKAGVLPTEDNKTIKLKDKKLEAVIGLDGQDHIDPSTKISVPTHAISIDVSNQNLAAVCLASGGTYNDF